MRSGVRLTILLIASAMAAQVPSTRARSVAMPNPPQLPRITENVLPGEGWTPGTYKVTARAVFLDTWKPNRRQISVLEPGTVVTLLAGVSEVDEPDRITVTSPLAEFDLAPGDSILRYTGHGEGYAEFWIKGRWYSDLDGSFVTEAGGSGCQSNCKARVVTAGRKTWWFRVELADHRIGWTNALDSLIPI